MSGMVKLQVFITDDCWTCAESRRIVAEIAPQFPEVTVQLVDVNVVGQPEDIFAVPTYVLNGRVISLGNPHRADLRQKLRTALRSPQT